MKSQPIYTLHERIWHWVQALTITVLLATGAEIHAPETFRWFGFVNAVRIHNAFAVLMLANAVLGIFYFVTSGLIRHYVPRQADFYVLAISQTRYYLRGIFRGEPHPIEHGGEQKLNPLQQVTYLAILNVLLPLQILSGIAVWGAQRWPAWTDRVGGLPFLVPIHSLVAWLFFAFLILHIYLTTTGRTPLSNIAAMIDGGQKTEARS